MTFHDGFPVLQKIFDAACRMVTAEVMKVDPRSPNFKDVLAATQQDARAVNEFCAAVRKSFLYHEQMAVNEIEKEADKEESRRAPN